nr:hypothetical protein [Tanacetum cinerariifolium]
RRRRKNIAKKRVAPIVDIADAALIKFDSDSGSDDDPLPYAPYASWKMVPSPLGFVHAYSDMARHTKHFTSLPELLHKVERTDLQKLLGTVHILETMDGRVIYMFVDVSYPLSAATLEHMLKHGLEVPKLLVGGDLTMAEQLISFIKAMLLNAQSAMLLFYDLAVFGVPAGFSCWSPYSRWCLVVAVWLVAAGFVFFMLLE